MAEFTIGNRFQMNLMWVLRLQEYSNVVQTFWDSKLFLYSKYTHQTFKWLILFVSIMTRKKNTHISLNHKENVNLRDFLTCASLNQKHDHIYEIAGRAFFQRLGAPATVTDYAHYVPKFATKILLKIVKNPSISILFLKAFDNQEI